MSNPKKITPAVKVQDVVGLVPFTNDTQQAFCLSYVLARAGCLLSPMVGANEADHALAAWKKIQEGCK